MSEMIELGPPKVKTEIRVGHVSSVDGDLFLDLQSGYGAVLAHVGMLDDQCLALVLFGTCMNSAELIVARDSETLNRLIADLEQQLLVRYDNLKVVYRSDKDKTR